MLVSGSEAILNAEEMVRLGRSLSHFLAWSVVARRKAGRRCGFLYQLGVARFSGSISLASALYHYQRSECESTRVFGAA
jgi:hypothetical protein